MNSEAVTTKARALPGHDSTSPREVLRTVKGLIACSSSTVLPASAYKCVHRTPLGGIRPIKTPFDLAYGKNWAAPLRI